MNAVCALDLMRVLAVEDELEDGGHIKDELESRLEAEVVPVTQLAEARRLLDSNDFDLITLDCISCLEWLQELAQDRGLPPVVVITRQGAEAAAAHALQSGASGFVVKAPGWGDQLAQVAEAVVADSLLQKATDVLDERSASVAAAVDESDELFFVFDREARLVRWNKALRSLMGYKDDEMVDLDLGHFFLPEDAQRLENEFPRLSSNVTSLSLRLVPKAGKPILCDVRIGAVRDFSQQLVGIFGSGRESEQESNIAALTGLVIAHADENGVVTYINDEALEFLGKQRDEVLGKTVVEFMHPDDVGISLDAWREAVLGKTTKVGIIRTRTPLGWRYVEWNGVPRFDGTGHFIGFQVTGRNVTERQRSEELLKQMNAELEAFAHTVSHDLRGPLATMMMAADTLHQLIKDSADDEADMTISELAQMISDGTATAGALIEDLLRLAESGLAPREVEPVDIGEVVDQVALDHLALIEERHGRVSHEPALGYLVSNRTQMYPVFSNLICNAFRHGGAERPEVQVSIVKSWPGGHLYRLRDNGAGIPEDEISEIFEPFYKCESGGTGIGLSTVRKIVKTYGGSIRAYNDNGAVFEFSLNDYHP